MILDTIRTMTEDCFNVFEFFSKTKQLSVIHGMENHLTQSRILNGNIHHRPVSVYMKFREEKFSFSPRRISYKLKHYNSEDFNIPHYTS